MAESAQFLTVALGVCFFCTGLLALVVGALLSRISKLESRLVRYRADQRADRVRLDDLEPARGRELRRRARREAYQRRVEQAAATDGNAH